MIELTLLAAAGSAILGGVFFAFSSFVMTALDNIPHSEGIRAMQRINIDVFSWSFSLLFLGMPLLVIIIAVLAVINWLEPQSVYNLSASILYIVGTVLVTGSGNVPLNNRLARLDPDAIIAKAEWNKYLLSWTRWNHLRTAACLLTSLILIAGII
jgi:uncharacterized membrane protein